MDVSNLLVEILVKWHLVFVVSKSIGSFMLLISWNFRVIVHLQRKLNNLHIIEKVVDNLLFVYPPRESMCRLLRDSGKWKLSLSYLTPQLDKGTIDRVTG